ncbi:hypothetical protein BGZ97_004299, partial [Linnemannia gamsii]
MQPFQRFRLGDMVETLAVCQDGDGLPYSQLTDIQETFPGAIRFKREGVTLNFLEDENKKKYEPKRISHYPDDIIDIVLASPPVMAYTMVDAKSHTNEPAYPPQLLTGENMTMALASLSIQPLSPTTCSDALVPLSLSSSPSASTFSSSSVVLSQTSIARPMAVLSSIASEISQIQTKLDLSADNQFAYHNQHMQQLFHMVQRQNDTLTKLAEAKEREEKMLEELAAAKERDDEIKRVQQQTVDRLIVTQQKIEAILVQNYELHEYPIPRLFVVLPDSYEKWNPMNTLAERFRLFFLCECEGHSNPDIESAASPDQPNVTTAASTAPIVVKNNIHLAKHEGYELSRPTEFFEQYGPYVLGMLRILRHCLAVATVVAPAAALAENGLKDVMDGAKSISESTLEAVDISITFLKQKLEGDAVVDEIAECRTDIQEDVFSGLAALEGADLRRLESFLRKKDADKILGNLYRMTTETGHVKWVCLDHYRQVYREMAMESFLQCVETNGGSYDPYFGKTVVRLKSSTVAKDFFSRLSTQAPAVIGLNVTLDWQCDSADLMMLVDKVAQSNVQDMALVLKEPVSGTPLATRMKPGKGRYNSLLSLLSNVKIRSLALTDVGRLGLRTSSLPISNNSSLLQSFHFSGLIKNFDDARLAEIITHCRQLVDLRLGSRKWNGDETPLIDRAIGTLSGLKVLHRYCLYSGKYAATQGTSTCAPYGSVGLREIVDFGLPYPSGSAGLLENAIRRSSATLEVLVLHSRQTPRTFNLADFISGSISAPASSDCLLFARLTHLEIFSNCKRDSVELFGSILPQLALIHLSVHAPTSVLLNHVNLKCLKSLNVKQTKEDVLNSFCDRARLSPNCQIESLRLCNIEPTPNLLDFL